MHRFFILEFNDDKFFDEHFENAIHLIAKIDAMLRNDLLVRVFQAMDSKKKQIKRSFNIRYLAYAYVFHRSNPEYSMSFLKTFMFSNMDNHALPSIRGNLDILTDTRVADPNDFETLLKSIVHMLDFGGYKFFLNIIYFCDQLADFEMIEKFVEYYEKMAKPIYFEYQFALLGLDDISSDEDEIGN